MLSQLAAAPRTVRGAAAVTVVATLVLLACCESISISVSTHRREFDDTESAKVAAVVVRPGPGDVTVSATGPAGQVRVERVLRYDGDQPPTRYDIVGDELVLETDCGDRCTISYDVTVPSGTSVRGEGGSGDVRLTDVGAVDLRVTSGTLLIARADGPVRAAADSGDVRVEEATGPVTMRTYSGVINGWSLRGEVDAETDSGDVSVRLTTVSSARVHTISGNVDLMVPDGRYRVRYDVARNVVVELGIPDDPTASALLDVRSAAGGEVAVNAH